MVDTMAEELTGIAGWAVGLMEVLGAPGAGLAVALENLFPPIPSEIILPLAGLAASRGDLGLVDVLVWTTIGSLVGALILYGVGRGLGVERLRTVARKVPLLEVRDIDRTEQWFHRHGPKAVFFGRMLPVFRSLISIPAGVTKLNIALFAALTFLGSAIWNTLFVLAGYLLGENWHVIEPYADTFQIVVIGLVVVALVVWTIRRIRAGRPTET
jgi:membrane protein DedA with SNARE-associated domain